MIIQAIPVGDHDLLMDCDECGPLGAYPRPLVHNAAQHHLTTHGIDMPPTHTCDCGYDYEHVTGHEKDKVACTGCDWSAVGIYADHNAHHHYLDTQHAWALTMGNKR